MTFLPDTATMLAYLVACLVLFITPGPDMSLFLTRTLAGGRAAGVSAMFGTMAGLCLHTLLAALGVSALIAASPAAFGVLKVVGALYLLWLAVDAVRNGSALSLKPDGREPARLGRAFWAGFLTDLTNPKIVLFFVTFLPQFVEPADPHVAGKLVFLGLFYVAFSIPAALALILVAERTVTLLRCNPRIMRAIDYLFAGIFCLFALRVAFTQSR